MRSRFLPPMLSAGLLLLASTSSIGAAKGRADDPPGSDAITTRSCATPELNAAEMEAVMAQVNKWLGENATLAVGGQIKVAWHVIYNGSTGNIPQSQIDAQI